MARARKCTKCKEKKSNYTVYKNVAICDECYNSYMDSIIRCCSCGNLLQRRKEYLNSEMNKIDISKSFCSEKCYKKVKNDQKTLENIDIWLKNYFKMDKLNPRIYMQLNEFQKKFNMTPEGILYTLNYINTETNKEILNNSLTIVTWYYESAKQHYIEKQKVKDKINQFNSLNNSMFQNSTSKVKVNRTIDNRKDKILITEIDFD